MASYKNVSILLIYIFHIGTWFAIQDIVHAFKEK